MTAGVCATRTSATSPRRTWPPPGLSISRLRTLATLRRVVGRALDDHLEDLLVLEDAADLDALQQRGLRAAHVAGLDAPARAFARSTSISRFGCVGRQLDARVDDAVDAGHELLHLRRLAAQDGLVLAEDAHGERLVGAGQHVEAVARDRVLAFAAARRRRGSSASSR